MEYDRLSILSMCGGIFKIWRFLSLSQACNCPIAVHTICVCAYAERFLQARACLVLATLTLLPKFNKKNRQNIHRDYAFFSTFLSKYFFLIFHFLFHLCSLTILLSLIEKSRRNSFVYIILKRFSLQYLTEYRLSVTSYHRLALYVCVCVCCVCVFIYICGRITGRPILVYVFIMDHMDAF